MSAYEERARVTLPPRIQAQADAKLQALNEQLRRKGTARKEVEIHPITLYGTGNEPPPSSSGAHVAGAMSTGGANADARFSDLLRRGGGAGESESANANEHDDGFDDERDFLSDAELDRLERPQVCMMCSFFFLCRFLAPSRIDLIRSLSSSFLSHLFSCLSFHFLHWLLNSLFSLTRLGFLCLSFSLSFSLFLSLRLASAT